MSAIESSDLQNIATARLESQTDQPAGPSVLPPFSGKLNEDKGLKLSNQNFMQLIENTFNTNITLRNQVQRNPTHLFLGHLAANSNLATTLGYFFKSKVVTDISQLTAMPTFPTPHVLAQFAYKAYEDYKKQETDAHYEERLALPDGWKLLTTASNGSWSNGYFGAAYWHPEHQQVVIAHRGTKLTNLGALGADLKGVVRNEYVCQMESASTFAHKVVEVLQAVSRSRGVSFQLFFTGHSLGGWLAQITTFTTKYLKREGNIFLKRNNEQDCYHPHTVVFDSPGCKDMLLKMTDKFDVRLNGRSIDIEHLDITSYLSAPNRINTCNKHVGTVYRIFTDLPAVVWWKKLIPSYSVETHSMNKIVQAFDPETGQVNKDEQGQLKVQVVVDWPISVGLMGGEEYKRFFEWAKHLNNYHPDIKEVSFQHSCPIRYQTKIYDERVNSLSIFSEEEEEFLQCYHKLRQWPEFCKPKELFAVLGDSQAQDITEKILQNFEIESDTVRCKDAIELQNMISYVKRLLQLFPQIKGFGNRIYQRETSSCIEKMKQSPLDFNPDAVNIREFLKDEQKHVLQVQMVGGDEWTGLIKVYQVLQKTNCLMEGQYTVLKLERLVTLNMLMEFRTLMLSIKSPYIILVACEGSQLLKEETKDMINTIFETMKKNHFIKIIFTTRSEDREIPSLQDISRDKFWNVFVTKVEQVTWCDLTPTSQQKLLEKSVTFQDANISLKEIMSVESAVGNFVPLGALLEEKELKIADPVPNSNGYDERFYIGRTLRHGKAIKQEIFSDKDVKEENVYLVSTEKEFKQLCQMNHNSNVHWLEKDKSGKVVWQQSQGSLVTLRRYIDTDSSHTYTADDLDKLLEQAEHQRVILISDTAGMGKSTVLTHLSKQIKQKFPAKWVVRIDLNDHTDALEELKQQEISKEKMVEFVSEKLLKLKHGLELELFKEFCEKKQKVRLVIMLDGFDEISPFYKETVIDLVQALRQTAVEQLWVTTRPHLREQLEDKLQQLSYTLEPFSENNQVEFLTKFWSLKDWFTETNDKEEEKEKSKLEIYAEELIKKLSESISDKDRQFTGIPLQTRLLAEAYDEKARTFYRSDKSKPEISDKLDLLWLYETFVERKYDIYQEEKLQVSVNKAAAKEQREHDLKSMRLDYQLLALKMLFNEGQVALCQKSKECSFSAEKLTRIGIVQKICEGKLNFIHRTFAEYYVADCLVNSLTEGKNNSEQIQTFILKEIFLENDYRVIRVFVDCLLSRTNPTMEVLKQYGNQIQDLRMYDDLILHNAVFEGNSKIIEFLLDSVQEGNHRDTIKEILLAKHGEGFTAWQISVLSNNTQVLEKLWLWAEKKLTAKEIKNELLLAGVAVNFSEKPGWWDKLRDPPMLWRNELVLLPYGKLFLHTSYKAETVCHMAAHLGKLKVLEKLWEWVKEKLTAEDINKLLLAADNVGRTVWHLAAEKGNLETLQKVWEWAKEKLTKEEINNKVLLGTDKNGRTAWHVAAYWGRLGILKILWEWAKEKLTTEEINNKLLLGTDNEGKTALYWAAGMGKLEVLQKVWEWVEENLTTEAINNKLLLGTDNEGRTVWHWAALKGRLEILQIVWEWAKEKLTTEEINNKLLLGTDIKRRTALHWAAGWGKLEVLQKVWEWAEEKLTTEEINNKLLLGTDKEGRTAWHWVAYLGRLEVLQIIWQWAKEKLTAEEIKNKLLLGTDNRGRTAWHWAAELGSLEILAIVWEWAKEKLTTAEIINKLLLDANNEGKTAWHLAAKNGNLEIFHKIWECAEEKLRTEEIKNTFLLCADNEGKNALHWAAERGNLEVLKRVWEWAEEKLTTEEINNKLLLGTDNEGRTVWHWAAYWGRLEISLIVWEWAKKKLTTEEINNKLLDTDNEGKTAWHRAADWGRLEILQIVWEWAEENLTKEEINNKFLLGTDKKGRTAWHWAVYWGRLEVLQIVWEWAKEKLTTEEINNKFLLATDHKGRTAWHWAAEWGRLEILQKVWEWAKEKLATEEIYNKLLLGTDKDGRTAWHLAAKKGDLEVFHIIWKCAEEKLTTEEINNKLLLCTDSKGKTALQWAAEWGNLETLHKI